MSLPSKFGDSGSTSFSLIEQAKLGDSQAWRDLVGLYAPLVYSWCRSSGLQAEDAADLVQDVFRSVSTGLSRYQHHVHGGSFRGWLRSITRTRLIDHFRKQQEAVLARGGTTNQGVLQQVEESSGADSVELPPDSLQVEQLHAALEVLRGQIEERTWQAFWRTTVEEVPAAEVAAELGMKRQAVFEAKSRVLRKLRGLLAAATGSPGQESS